MIMKNSINGKSPSTSVATSVETTEKNVGRVVIIRAKVVEYDTAIGRALVVPADYAPGMADEMMIPFEDILEWHEREATDGAADGAK